ncbi:helix-turn-helix transcriptional regulator [Pseudomonas sp. CCC3.1]|uniref:helix-turn-helix domain-containing protein n=1 Tax=Pseudomonas sp. CCC3.1 TaxID=3048607 RepID=UPI002AC918EF|nr:helix-turn-helix transcriptional regulator [Pseudomonas sp. CCC3.1]MEB0207130.1 helix-turn-helix transcriptional regulator [Pseudomonas sp. CCC3.1]WPX34854.1 helix-turn-helix transcriptional regulator [Pseudomonas sp. CCC3.1]
MVLGQRIRALRKALGLTQAQLAESLDYEPMTISRFERGEYSPGFDALHQLAKALGVSLASLLQFEAKEPLGAGELRHQLCDIIYETEDPKVLMGMLKAIRKARGG